jgi:hypothetical protein
MERITTPTAVPNKFGPGKNGFQGGGPPNATQLSPEWFDNVQEETARVIEGQGIVLDGGQLDQMKQAIDDYAFADPSITGTLTIENLASIEVESGGAINVQSGGTLDTMAGSIVGLQGAVTFTPTATHTCDTVANFNKGVNLGDDVADPIAVNGTMTVNENAAMHADLAVLGASGGSLSSDMTAIMTWNGTATLTHRTRILSSILSTVGDFGKDGAGNMRWHDGTADRIGHVSDSGWFRGHGQVDTAAAAATISVDTTTPVAPKAAADVDIVANLQIQRAVAGDVEVSISEVGGAGVIGVVKNYAAPVTGTTTYLHLTFARTRVAADTTPRVYRVTVDGLGSNVNLGLGRIVAEPAVG